MNNTIQYGGSLIEALDWLCLNLPNGTLLVVNHIIVNGFIINVSLHFIISVMIYQIILCYFINVIFNPNTDTISHSISHYGCTNGFVDELPDSFSHAITIEEQRLRPERTKFDTSLQKNALGVKIAIENLDEENAEVK